MALGQASGTPTDNVEIIDLVSETFTCNDFPSFTYAAERIKGELGHNENPVICGGTPAVKECHSFENGVWIPSGSLSDGGYDFAMTKAPFQNESISLLKTGGYSDGAAFDTAEVLVNGQWQPISFPLPFTITNHCMVKYEETSVMVVSGQQNRFNSKNTYILNSGSEEWIAGPKINFARGYHGCSRVPQSEGSSDYSIIVAGGNNGTYMSSVEILDTGSNTWRAGPDLPMTICCGVMIEHPLGGVVLVGGKSGTNNYLDTLYYLRHADAEWEELPQKLKLGRGQHTAFIVPEGVADYC